MESEKLSIAGRTVPAEPAFQSDNPGCNRTFRQMAPETAFHILERVPRLRRINREGRAQKGEQRKREREKQKKGESAGGSLTAVPSRTLSSYDVYKAKFFR